MCVCERVCVCEREIRHRERNREQDRDRDQERAKMGGRNREKVEGGEIEVGYVVCVCETVYV